MSTMSELLYLPYSPWSEKARWALDARRVPHERRVFQPLIGEPTLRLRVRRLRGRVSVPVFFHGGKAVEDSYGIALLAEEIGTGPSLFPAGREAEIARYNELSERGLAAGRALALARNLQNADAMLELVPKALRGALGGLELQLARFGLQRTLRKYGANHTSHEAHERTLCEVLDVLRADLSRASGQPQTLLGQFSYADIAMAQVLGFVEPPRAGLRIGKHSREAFTHPVLRERYRDVLEWRDALYAAYRQDAG